MGGSLPREAKQIVLTGGSCGGKTTAIGLLPGLLKPYQVRVIAVPEVATMLISQGLVNIGDVVRSDGEANCRFQREIFKTHRALRVRAAEMAKAFSDERVVLFFDRGEIDARAYHDHDCFDGLAAEEATTMEDIRDSYDAVIHLVTTADGAEEFFGNATNASRWDNAEEARRTDQIMAREWSGHPRFYQVDNSTDFPGKMHRILNAILEELELPAQTEFDLPVLALKAQVSEPDLFVSGQLEPRTSQVAMAAATS